MESSVRQMVIMIVFSTLLVTGLIVSARLLGLESQYVTFLTWAQDSGTNGKILIAILLLVSVLFLLPSVHLTMGAGLLFGVVEGAAIVVASETIAAVIAYYIGRQANRSSLMLRLSRTSVFSSIDALVQKGGWELVAATRMVPFFPFKLSNYAFGLTVVRLRDYVIGTFIGLWPIAVFNAYLGSIANDVMSIGAGTPRRSVADWGIYIGGFALVLLVLLFTARRASQRIQSV